MKQLVIGFVLGIIACAMTWSFSTGEAHGQSRGDRSAVRAPGHGGGNDGGVAGGGPCGGCAGDLNNDNTVGVADLLILLANWGLCPCPAGQTDCAGACVDTGSDPDNCGGCGIECGIGEICVNGQCAAAQCTTNAQCDDGIQCTIDQCINFQCVHTPAPNGQACDDGSACTVSDSCQNGTCVGQSICGPNSTCAGNSCVCDFGFGDCDGNPGTGCEVDLTSNNSHCGGCNVQCPIGTQCVNAACVPMFTWYEDLDGDGFGNCAVFVVAPSPPPGWVSACGDCDDTDPSVFPGAPEICNDGIDNNCNGVVDCDDPECGGDPNCP